MNAESLLHYLKNPVHLYDITYQELQNLIGQYPYCQNLRYLLVRKSKLENHKNYQRDLHIAATYSINRKLLHQQLMLTDYHQTSTDSTLVPTEDYLELSSLDQFETQLEEQKVYSLQEDTTVEFEAPSEILPNIALDLSTDQTSPSIEKETILPTLEEEIDEDLLDALTSLEDEDKNENLLEESLSDLEDELESPSSQEDGSSIPDEANEEENVVSFDDFFEEQLNEEPPESTSDEELPLEEEFMGETVEDSVSMLEDTKEEATLSVEEAIPDEAIEVEEEVIVTIPLVVENEEKSAIDRLFEEMDEEEEPKSEEELDFLKSKIPFVVTNDEEEIEEKAPSDTSTLQPAPKQSFSSWLKQFQPPLSQAIESAPPKPIKEEESKGELEQKKAKENKKKERNEKMKAFLKAQKKKKKKKKKKEKKAKPTLTLASKSISESEDVLSETLASLLATQGYADKAIQMYERLGLIFPEKSAYFAGKIEELQTKE